jgi:proton glutamate symport protein
LGIALPDPAQVMDKVEGRGIRDLVEVLKRTIPSNIFAAALEVQLLALVFVGVVFGYFMSRLNGPAGDTLQQFWVGLHDLMILITMWIMRFAPIGAFALVGKTLLVSGFAALEALGLFFLTVLLALAVHFAVWLPLLLRLVAGISPYAYYAKIAPAQLTAFSTASSSATLPVTINSAEQAGISNRVTSFVLPLGATVNMDGTALYECVVVVFIAQVYAFASGVDFGIAEQMIVVLLALLTSIGVAGIPAASLVAIALILPAVGLPVEAIAIVLAVDRLLDMCRTTVNVTGDLVVTALVARTEGEDLPDVRA